MKILIAGSAGFIGSHVAHALLDEGHEVVGLDSLNSFFPIGYSGHLRQDFSGLLCKKSLEKNIQVVDVDALREFICAVFSSMASRFPHTDHSTLTKRRFIA